MQYKQIVKANFEYSNNQDFKIVVDYIEGMLKAIKSHNTQVHKAKILTAQKIRLACSYAKHRVKIV